MPSIVALNQELDVIEIIFLESITTQDLMQTTTEALKLADVHNLTRFLINISEADLVAPLVDVYDLPDKHYDEMGANRKNCVALISSASTKSMKDAQFYENACNNRGWTVNSFTNQKDAIEWLTSLIKD